jgi:hypothetical protein
LLKVYIIGKKDAVVLKAVQLAVNKEAGRRLTCPRTKAPTGLNMHGK